MQRYPYFQIFNRFAPLRQDLFQSSVVILYFNYSLDIIPSMSEDVFLEHI